MSNCVLLYLQLYLPIKFKKKKKKFPQKYLDVDTIFKNHGIYSLKRKDYVRRTSLAVNPRSSECPKYMYL